MPTAGEDGTVTTSGYQKAGFFYQILPYIEQDAVYRENGNAGARPIKAYFCPSRRTAQIWTTSWNQQMAPNDYATATWRAAGDTKGGGGQWGCWDWGNDTSNPQSYQNCVIVRGGASGTGFAAPTLISVTDGTSNTVLVSEKLMEPVAYSGKTESYGLWWSDARFTGGWDWSTTRCSMAQPSQDKPGASFQTFGSAHGGGMNAVLSDGSVRVISYNVPSNIFQLLCQKADGLAIDLASWF